MSRPASLTLVIALCLASVALRLLPEAAQNRWRAAVRDVLRPGQSAVQMSAAGAKAAVARLAPRRADVAALREATLRVDALERHNRRLRVVVATLERMAGGSDPGAGDPRGEARPALFVPQ